MFEANISEWWTYIQGKFRWQCEITEWKYSSYNISDIYVYRNVWDTWACTCALNWSLVGTSSSHPSRLFPS